MAREISVPEVGTILYKVCPKCSDKHVECDRNCAWFGVENPCGIVHREYKLMIIEKKFHDGWRIKDLAMIGEKYFTDPNEAQDEINRIKG